MYMYIKKKKKIVILGYQHISHIVMFNSQHSIDYLKTNDIV